VNKLPALNPPPPGSAAIRCDADIAGDFQPLGTAWHQNAIHAIRLAT